MEFVRDIWEGSSRVFRGTSNVPFMGSIKALPAWRGRDAEGMVENEQKSCQNGCLTSPCWMMLADPVTMLIGLCNDLHNK